ncbi:MAG: tripartite tricarboxylate transporter TctB family protein [Paracoccaceae bacterium]|nr:tripartite tricarboxylate transporter TctB family protein [Paracoccaceae bacterium]
MISSDRIFGLVVVFGALAFFAGALQIQTSFLSDPVGPRLFPILIAVVSLLAGLMMLWKPDAEPDWPAASAWGNMAITMVVLVAYAYLLAPLGFVLPTAVAAAVISYMIAPHIRPAAITGAVLSLSLFFIFKYSLGLGLVALPKALFG